MQDFGTKADNSPPPGGQLSAVEFNNLATENENAVSRSGQTLSGASDTQLAESLFLHAVKSESFQDSGAANAYVATPVSGASGVLLPASYANMGGAVISFKASAANTGASTLNIGQTTGTLLGSKPIRTSGDTALASNTIAAGTHVRVIYNPAFDAGGGAWEFIRESLIGIQRFSASGTYTPSPGMRFAIAKVQGAGGSGGGAPLTLAGQLSLGGGGGSGAYAEGVLTATQIGASQTITIGTGGTGTAGNGNAGGASSIGALISAPGGLGGAGLPSVTSTTVSVVSGGLSSAVATGGTLLNTTGQGGSIGVISNNGVLSGYGAGGAISGGSGGGSAAGVGNNGAAATSPGSGGGGACNNVSSAARLGGAGFDGLVLIWEYA